MNLNDEPAKDVLNRFMWKDENTIRVISKEGIEMIIDIKDNFK
jgi:hypothetical protein